MVSWKSMLIGGALFVAVAASGTASSDPHQTTYLTFSGPISLPGVALGSGTYTFELASPATSRDLVVVMNRERNRVYYLGFTQDVERPDRQEDDITFGESAAGQAPPITAWYPRGEKHGHRFIY